MNDHTVVFDSLLRNREASLGESVLASLPEEWRQRAGRYGLYFSTEDFAAGRLTHDFHHAAQPALDHHGEAAT